MENIRKLLEEKGYSEKDFEYFEYSFFEILARKEQLRALLRYHGSQGTRKQQMAEAIESLLL